MILLAVTLSTVFVASVQAVDSTTVKPTVTPSPSTQSAAENNMCGFKINPTATTSATVPKNLSYACQPDGTIVIYGDQFNAAMVNVKVLKPVHDDSTSCSTFTCSQPSSDVTISNCDRGKPVLIVLDTANDTQTIYGGSGEKSFTLTCDITFTAVVTYTASPFKNSFVPDNAVTNIPPKHVMKIVGLHDTSEKFSATVGEQLRLMVQSKDKSYYVQALQCSANNGHDLSIDLWDKKTLDKDIFEDKWKDENATDFSTHSTLGTFYAFRFKDSEKVNFKCKVKFCYKAPCAEIQHTNIKRKRNSEDQNHLIRTLEQSLIVTDVYNGFSRPTCCPLLLVLMVTIAIKWFV